MTSLLLGAALAVAALVFVLYPLFREIGSPAIPLARRPAVRGGGDGESAIDALREIEFDRETGKLSDSDYTTLRTEYTRRALVEMRTTSPATDAAPTTGAIAVAVSAPALDAAEAAVLRYRQHRMACGDCGPRPEPDAVYCSSCGRYLSGTCGACGAPVDAIGARFCASCGHTLAA
jgi:cytochrome c-type biogenesis protein CcmI